jgi:hypothetical protein
MCTPTKHALFGRDVAWVGWGYTNVMTPAVTLASNYVKPKRISLKTHPALNERWVQDRIAEDPSILGLGDLALVRKELQQPSGGRLDLLLADRDGEETADKRYEVEVQLGLTDPSHIIRTIEYWDVERTRNPSREHFAVLVAEDITSRFLNVLSLLNKSVPLIAIQMQALEIGGHLTLVFTTVVDLSLREDEDQDTPPVVDRAYWEKKQGKPWLDVVDEFFGFVTSVDPGFELRYNQQYIAVNKDGRTFLGFAPQKGGVRLKIKVKKLDEFENEIQQSGLDVPEYRNNGYRFLINGDMLKQHGDALKHLIGLALKA